MTTEVLIAGAMCFMALIIEFLIFKRTGRHPTGAVLGILGFFLGLAVSVEHVKKIRTEAVERGFAEYIENSDGSTTWTWKSR